MEFLRFPIPEFNFKQFKNLDWNEPTFLSAEEMEEIASKRDGGGANVVGAYPVVADDAVFDKFDIRGDRCHAVMCVLPEDDVHLLGRSYAWWNQRVVIVDSLDAGGLSVVHDWTTPRPMNTRLGPDDGVDLKGGIYYVISAHMYDDHWIGNRTLMDNDWDGDDAENGFRVLGASKEDANEFCECYLAFSWGGN